MFHADRRTDGHDKANNLFRNFANVPKNSYNGSRMALKCQNWVSLVVNYNTLVAWDMAPYSPVNGAPKFGCHVTTQKATLRAATCGTVRRKRSNPKTKEASNLLQTLVYTAEISEGSVLFNDAGDCQGYMSLDMDQ